MINIQIIIIPDRVHIKALHPTGSIVPHPRQLGQQIQEELHNVAQKTVCTAAQY